MQNNNSQLGHMKYNTLQMQTSHHPNTSIHHYVLFHHITDSKALHIKNGNVDHAMIFKVTAALSSLLSILSRLMSQPPSVANLQRPFLPL